MHTGKHVRLTAVASLAPNGVETAVGQVYDVLPDPVPNLFPLKGWVRINVPVEWREAPVMVWLKPGSFEEIAEPTP